MKTGVPSLKRQIGSLREGEKMTLHLIHFLPEDPLQTIAKLGHSKPSPGGSQH
jgi:hypothetical protein